MKSEGFSIYIEHWGKEENRLRHDAFRKKLEALLRTRLRSIQYCTLEDQWRHNGVLTAAMCELGRKLCEDRAIQRLCPKCGESLVGFRINAGFSLLSQCRSPVCQFVSNYVGQLFYGDGSKA